MSISIDTNAIFSNAQMVISMMMPILTLTSGFALGFSLVTKIAGLFARAI